MAYTESMVCGCALSVGMAFGLQSQLIPVLCGRGNDVTGGLELGTHSISDGSK